MKQFKFKDWAGNSFIIKAKDIYEARQKAKNEIVIQPFYIEYDLKLKFS